jgi:hypothetical protein
MGKGLAVYFVDRMPSRASEGWDGATNLLAEMAKLPQCHVVPLDDLANEVKKAGFAECIARTCEPYLRYYHYRRSGSDVFMFFNEHPYNAISTGVEIRTNEKNAVAYDAFENSIANEPLEALPEKVSLSLELSPYESKVVIFGKPGDLPTPAGRKQSPSKLTKWNAVPITGAWEVSTASSLEYPKFTPLDNVRELRDLCGPELLPNFCGTARYKIEFTWNASRREALLDLGQVFETAEVWVNDKSIGVKICPPYIYPVGEHLSAGKNTLMIEVTNTLVREVQDGFSRSVPLEPAGLLGPVVIRYAE